MQCRTVKGLSKLLDQFRRRNELPGVYIDQPGYESRADSRIFVGGKYLNDIWEFKKSPYF